MLNEKDISKLADQTQFVYERNAVRFAAERPKNLIEKPWLDLFLSLIPESSLILDLGCGSGDPIAAYLMQKGHRIIGLDASPTMIGLANEKFPLGDWRVGDMRVFEYTDRFNGIIGWNSFFHLTREEQRKTIPVLTRHLLQEGALMLTVGPQEGEVAGCVGDEPIYHASLSPREYAEILSGLGMEVVKFVAEDPDCYEMSIMLAQRKGD